MGELSRYVGEEGVESAPDEGGGDYGPLPAGWYPAGVESAEVKPNSKGTGHLLAVKFRILTGKGANKPIVERINVSHKSAKCQEIGLQKLSALGDACGMPRVADEDLLIGKHLDIRLKIEPTRTHNGKTYDADNAVSSYARLGTKSGEAKVERPAYPQGPQQPAPANSPSGQPAAAPAKTGGMPWDR